MWNGGRKWRQPLTCKPKGARGLPFQWQAERRPLCLPVSRTDLHTPNSFVFFDTCIIPTLAPRCATIAFNASGGVTILFRIWIGQTQGFLLVFQFLLIKHHCHRHYSWRKNALNLYYLWQLIYIFLLRISIYYLVYLIYKPMTSWHSPYDNQLLNCNANSASRSLSSSMS